MDNKLSLWWLIVAQITIDASFYQIHTRFVDMFIASTKNISVFIIVIVTSRNVFALNTAISAMCVNNWTLMSAGRR